MEELKKNDTQGIAGNREELLREISYLRRELFRMRSTLAKNPPSNGAGEDIDYLRKLLHVDETMRRASRPEDMVGDALLALRAVFPCEQSWLMFPCDPNSATWSLPFHSADSEYPIPFPTDDVLPMTSDLAENFRLALTSKIPLPLGPGAVKDVPMEAKAVKARSALLIAIHPNIGPPWLLGLHRCVDDRHWADMDIRLFSDLSGRVSDALSIYLYFREQESSRQRLQHLSSRLIRAQEDERRRIAKEIHDDLGQNTLAIKVGVENALFQLGDEVDERVGKSLNAVASVAGSMVEGLRTMQTNLYPSTLHNFGIVPALRNFIRTFQDIHRDIQVQENFRIDESCVSDDLRLTIFRIAQEAFNNAARHSECTHLSIILEIRGTCLHLVVADDGQGFDPGNSVQPGQRLGLGLVSMRERAEMSGGIFELSAAPESGTVITCKWDVID